MSPVLSNDSYLIYSELLREELQSEVQPVKLYLVDDTTTALVEQDKSCASGDMWSRELNPHSNLIKPPPAYEQDWKDMLDDFDKRCHERVSLSADLMKLDIPVRTVTEAQRKLYMDAANLMYFQDKDGEIVEAGTPHTPEEHAQMNDLDQARAIFRLSEVYFNAHKTIAMVYYDKMRGQQGEGGWKIFESNLGVGSPRGSGLAAGG